MASLSRFKTDLSRKNDGGWVKLGEEFSEIEIKTRGFTDAYSDARQAKMRRAGSRYGGDLQKIPQAEVRAILIELLITHCLLDVRNLEDTEGNPVSFELFKELLHEDAYIDLYGAALQAASQVTAEREADLQAAKKNSPTPSA